MLDESHKILENLTFGCRKPVPAGSHTPLRRFYPLSSVTLRICSYTRSLESCHIDLHWGLILLQGWRHSLVVVARFNAGLSSFLGWERDCKVDLRGIEGFRMLSFFRAWPATLISECFSFPVRALVCGVWLNRPLGSLRICISNKSQLTLLLLVWDETTLVWDTWWVWIFTCCSFATLTTRCGAWLSATSAWDYRRGRIPSKLP